MCDTPIVSHRKSLILRFLVPQSLSHEPPHKRKVLLSDIAAKIRAQDFSSLTAGHPLSQERLPAPPPPLPCHLYEKKSGRAD